MQIALSGKCLLDLRRHDRLLAGPATTASAATGSSGDLGGDWPLASTAPSTITGPRAADGSVPASDFLRPASGVDVGARL